MQGAVVNLQNGDPHSSVIEEDSGIIGTTQLNFIQAPKVSDIQREIYRKGDGTSSTEVSSTTSIVISNTIQFLQQIDAKGMPLEGSV